MVLGAGQGEILRTGVLQFGHPVASIVLAAALLVEPIGSATVLGAATVPVGVWLAVRVLTAARFRESA